MDWQNWSSYEDEEEVDDAASGAGSGKAHFPDHAMQIRFPMRIQCYSRHHGEKLGYRWVDIDIFFHTVLKSLQSDFHHDRLAK